MALACPRERRGHAGCHRLSLSALRPPYTRVQHLTPWCAVRPIPHRSFEDASRCELFNCPCSLHPDRRRWRAIASGPTSSSARSTASPATAPVGTTYAYALGTTSCNIGTVDLTWIANTNQHPVIGQNIYRLRR